MLLAELKEAGKTAEAMAAVPVLSCFKIEVTGNVAIVSATDMDVYFRAEFPVEGVSDGEVLVTARVFQQIVAALPEGNVRLYTTDNATHVQRHRLHVEAGKFQATVGTLPAEDWPVAPDMRDATQPVQFERKLLKSLLSKTSFAMSDGGDVRFTMESVLLELSPEYTRTVATDGRRMSMVTAPALDGVTDLVSHTLRRKLVSQLLACPGDEPVDYRVSEKYLFFTLGSRSFAALKNDGAFPQYDRVMPKADKVVWSAVLERDHVEVAMRQVFAATKGGANAPTFTLQFHAGEMTVVSEVMELLSGTTTTKRKKKIEKDGTTAEATVPAVFDGADTKVKLNSSYIMQFLKHSGDRFTVDLSGDGMPILFSADPKDPEGGVDHKYVVMPMR